MQYPFELRWSWFTLIVGGVAAVLVTAIVAPPGGAVAVAALVIATWIIWFVSCEYRKSYHWRVLGHLGHGNWHTAELIKHTIPVYERPNVQLALDHLRRMTCPDEPMMGVPTNIYLVDVIQQKTQPVPIQWQRVPRSLDQELDCVTNGLYLLMHGDQPYLAAVTGAVEYNGQLMVMAQRRETVKAALSTILETARALSVYRGNIVSFESGGPDGLQVHFHDVPNVVRDAIVLPRELMEVLDRNIAGFFAALDNLRRLGQGTRHGVLLHGPPGVGKTMVTKYLTRACSKVTVILLTGHNLFLIRASCRLARLLTPSLIVLEDVDLIAQDRERNRENPLLHDLMDEMDGLGKNADCVFLLTTNRPETLEPALAARPGRVDQTIFFPLPDLDCRRRLFTKMTAGLDVTGVDMEPWLERTEGASPAFLQEFFRKVVVMALERGETSEPLRLRPEDFERAMRELVAFGGELTRNLLGFRQANIGFCSPEGASLR